MANHSVNHIVLSSQEITSVFNIIKLSLEAFKLVGFPIFYDCFLMHLYQLIQLGAAAVTAATPPMGLKEFSLELDVLANFRQEIAKINYFNFK